MEPLCRIQTDKDSLPITRKAPGTDSPAISPPRRCTQVCTAEGASLFERGTRIPECCKGSSHHRQGGLHKRSESRKSEKTPHFRAVSFRAASFGNTTCHVSSKKMPFAHHLLYRSEIFFLISGVITFLYCCAISQNWVFSSSITSFFSHRVLNKVGFPPRKIRRLLSGISWVMEEAGALHPTRWERRPHPAPA